MGKDEHEEECAEVPKIVLYGGGLIDDHVFALYCMDYEYMDARVRQNYNTQRATSHRIVNHTYLRIGRIIQLQVTVNALQT